MKFLKFKTLSIVFSIALALTLSALAFLLLLPTLYEATADLQIGYLVNDKGQISIESLDNISKVFSDEYGVKIRIFRQASIIKVSAMRDSPDPARDVVMAVVDQIVAKHRNIVNNYSNRLEWLLVCNRINQNESLLEGSSYVLHETKLISKIHIKTMPFSGMLYRSIPAVIILSWLLAFSIVILYDLFTSAKKSSELLKQ